MKTIEFFVPGVAATAGSKKGFHIPGKNGAKGRVIITAANKRQKPWMQDVKYAAEAAYNGAPVRGPVTMELTFYFTRPACHFGSGKNADKVKDSAPVDHTKKPDLFKLARAVEDAMTGIVYIDDCQVWKYSKLEKRYGQKPGVQVKIFLDE